MCVSEVYIYIYRESSKIDPQFFTGFRKPLFAPTMKQTCTPYTLYRAYVETTKIEQKFCVLAPIEADFSENWDTTTVFDAEAE